MEVPPEALRRSSEQREPPRKPAHTKAMELGKEKQREKRPESVRQHFVLSARKDPHRLPRLPPFIGDEGSRSGLTSYLPYLTTSIFLCT